MPLDPVATGGPHVAAHNQEREMLNQLEENLAGKIDIPAAQTGQNLRFNGIAWVPTITRVFEGENSPEGKVAAPIGSRYYNLLATRGDTEYLKVADGDSNTGWMVLNGDTGWRDFSAACNKRNGALINAARIRRVNNVVDIYLDATMPTAGDANWEVVTLPAGWFSGFARSGALQDNNEAAAATTQINSAGLLILYGITRGKRDRWNGTYTVPTGWVNKDFGTAI